MFIPAVQKYNAMKNELLEYHKVEMPRGLVVVGDAVQRLNALYGQVRHKIGSKCSLWYLLPVHTSSRLQTLS